MTQIAPYHRVGLKRRDAGDDQFRFKATAQREEHLSPTRGHYVGSEADLRHHRSQRNLIRRTVRFRGLPLSMELYRWSFCQHIFRTIKEET